MKLEDALKQFLEHLRTTDRSPKTISLYEGCLTRLNNYLQNKYNRPVYLDEVKADDFERYLFEPPNDKNFSQATRHTISTGFKSFCSFCFMKGYCKVNIGKQVIPIKANSKERTFISEDELLKIVDQVSNETDKAMLQTMFYTGMRISEAINLTFDDFYFNENYFYIRKRKGRYDRKIPINIKLRLILEEYLEYREGIETDSNKVFVDEYRGETKESHFNKMLKRAAEKAELDIKVSSHTMRHSFASNLIAKGVDIVKVKKLLGHEKIETTQIYLHVNAKLLKNDIDKL
jgi:integrase/recombinase XerD